MNRKTLSVPVQISGTGIHTGKKIELLLKPFKDGIVFVKKGVRIEAAPENVLDTRLNTTLGKEGESVSTVEHLLSAFYGLGITDCQVNVDGDELPGLDGSAWPYVQKISESGIQEIEGECKPVIVTEKIRVGDEAAWVEAAPGAFSVTYEIDFPENAIGRQVLVFEGNGYKKNIAPARTFGRLKDVEMMRSMGLALGGSLDNAIVVDGDKILNPEGLRFKDEFVRHKILDILGDLWLLGHPVAGCIRAYKARHELHVELAKQLRFKYRVR